MEARRMAKSQGHVASPASRATATPTHQCCRSWYVCLPSICAGVLLLPSLERFVSLFFRQDAYVLRSMRGCSDLLCRVSA